jgi:hypothetical protein
MPDGTKNKIKVYYLKEVLSCKGALMMDNSFRFGSECLVYCLSTCCQALERTLSIKAAALRALLAPLRAWGSDAAG